MLPVSESADQFSNLLFTPQIQSKVVVPPFGTTTFQSGQVLFTPIYLASISSRLSFFLKQMTTVWDITAPPDITLVFLAGVGSSQIPTFGTVGTAPIISSEELSENLLGLISLPSSDFSTIGSSMISSWHNDSGIVGLTSAVERNASVFVAGMIDENQAALTTGNLRLACQVAILPYSTY